MLLDEEELRPKADAWDIFYGKVPPVGAKTPVEAPLPPLAPDQESDVPAAPLADDPREAPELTHDPESQILAAGPSGERPSVRTAPTPETTRPQADETDAPPKKRETISIKPLTFKARRTNRAEGASSESGGIPLGVAATEVRSNEVPHPDLSGVTLSFEDWLKRWSPWLKRGGTLKVCKAFFELTHGRGSTKCFTSNSAIMSRTKLSRAQCIRNIHYLIEMGFLEELGESNNKEAKGTYYRFNLIPRSLTS